MQPSSRDKENFDSAMSMPMITEAPEIRAAMTEFRPTPPSPKTATFCPGRTPAELKTDPAPVTTAQPKSAATSNGMDGVNPY